MADGNTEAHQSVMTFQDGIRLYSGYLPIVFGGYPLPCPVDVGRLTNNDVLRMPLPVLVAERSWLRRALVAWLAVRACGVKQAWLSGVVPAPQAQPLGAWMAARFEAIDSRLRGVKHAEKEER